MAVLFFKDAGGQEAPHEGSMVANGALRLYVCGWGEVLQCSYDALQPVVAFNQSART